MKKTHLIIILLIIILILLIIYFFPISFQDLDGFPSLENVETVKIYSYKTDEKSYVPVIEYNEINDITYFYNKLDGLTLRRSPHAYQSFNFISENHLRIEIKEGSGGTYIILIDQKKIIAEDAGCFCGFKVK